MGAQTRKAALRNTLQKRLRDTLQPKRAESFDAQQPEAPKGPKGNLPTYCDSSHATKKQHQEYWSFVRKLRDEKEPVFKMPLNENTGVEGVVEAKMKEYIGQTKQ